MKLKSLFLGLVLFSIPNLISAQLILFQGQVVDSESGEALPNVEVRCELDQTTTNF
jgi:hypothetical protein